MSCCVVSLVPLRTHVTNGRDRRLSHFGLNIQAPALYVGVIALWLSVVCGDWAVVKLAAHVTQRNRPGALLDRIGAGKTRSV